MRIFTIGYEGATVPEFLSALQEAEVERVIDVRALPLSRRPGFSKSSLRGALEEAGIDYLHLRALGTPAEGRAAARAGRHDALRRIYDGQLATLEAQKELADLAALVVSGRRLCLLCYERQPQACHRSLIGERLHDVAEVRHLFPRPIDANS